MISFSDDETGARRKKSAALGRDDEVLAARRSLGVASVGYRTITELGR